MIHPPSVGPRAGATTAVMPYTANASPRCSRRKGVGQNRLRHRLQAAATGALQDAKHDQQPRVGATPQRTELTVNSAMQVRKNRLRPNTPAIHPLIGSTIAFDTR